MHSIAAGSSFWYTRPHGAKNYFEAARHAEGPARTAAYSSMLFECARALRTARDAPEAVQSAGIDPAEFVGVMEDVRAHRNVMEHWRDVINPRAPKMHAQTTKGGLKIASDETSMIIVGPEEVYKGKLNLHDVYLYVVAKLDQAKTT
jgi:hypothetical protein